MMMIIVILVVLLIISITYIFLLYKDIDKVMEDLKWIENTETNMLLRTKTFNKNFSDLIIIINQLLKKEKSIIFETNKLNKEMKQMISNISHDFRTPLTSTIGYVQLLSDEKITDDKKRDYLIVIENKLDDLRRIVNDFFEFTKVIESNNIQKLETANLSLIVEDTVFLYYHDFIAENINLKVDIKQDIYLISNINALKRITQNIVSNVLIHGIEMFEVSLFLKDKVYLSFKNKVNKDDKIDVDRIFDRFYTIDLSRTTKNTGLGLTIVKELVNQLDGEVQAILENDYLVITVIFNQNLKIGP